MQVTSKVLTHDALIAACVVGLRPYKGNVYIVSSQDGPTRFRFTLETRDAWAYGSRTAASGRHMRKASWEAHRDCLRALFDADPAAVVRSSLTTYRGREDFLERFPDTAHTNIGSRMSPVTMPECSIQG